MNEEDFYKREISIDDRLHGDLDAAEDILSELESGWENVYPPKKIFEKIFEGGGYAVAVSETYRALAICAGLKAKLLLEAFDEIIARVGKDVKVVSDEDYKKVAAEIITIHKKLDEDLSRLQNEKLSRYANSIKKNADRLEIFKRFKEQGMTDAETYRKIIEIENEDRKRPIKLGTTEYYAAMNSLRVWKSRTFSPKKDVTH